MNKAIALNQYNFQPEAGNKRSTKSQKSNSKSSFAEKVKAARRKGEQSALKEGTKELKNQKESKQEKLKKMMGKTAEEVAVQLASLDLSRIDQQKLNSLLKEVGLLENAGNNLFAESSAVDTLSELDFSELDTSELKSLISDLENLISNSEMELAENEKLSSLLKLLKEIDSGKSIESDNKIFAEKFADYFKNQNQAEQATDKLASLENNKEIQSSEKNAESEIITEAAEKNVDFNGSDQNELTQKVDFEQKNTTQKTLRQKSSEVNNGADKSKGDQGTRLFSSVKPKEVSDFNSKIVLETARGDNASEKKIIDFNFSGVESTLNPEVNAGDKANTFILNNTQLKGELPVKDQFVQQFKGEFSAAKNEMSIELKPESLGKIEVKLNLNEGKIDAKMLVENKLVQTQLESSIKGIKSDLIKQGINIEQFKIETAKAGPQQIEQQNEFNLNDHQNSAFSDGETGQNQEYEQRQFFQGQYYVQRSLENSGLDSLDGENLIMRQQEIINRAGFSKGELNLIV